MPSLNPFDIIALWRKQTGTKFFLVLNKGDRDRVYALAPVGEQKANAEDVAIRPEDWQSVLMPQPQTSIDLKNVAEYRLDHETTVLARLQGKTREQLQKIMSPVMVTS